MAEGFQTRTLKRKNVKGLALTAPPTKVANPSEGDSQIPGAIGNSDSNRVDTLEIGLEFKLDLRSEDLIVLKELGAGNGGTVSKVMHATTKVIMARKVRGTSHPTYYELRLIQNRSSGSMPRRMYANKLSESCRWATIAVRPT